jgi:hypothetical protein
MPIKPTAHRKGRALQVHPQLPNVDAIASNITYYSSICEEQSAVFREHVEEFTREYALYMQSADVVKPGQSWEPNLNDRDAFVAEMEKRCNVVPQSIAE